MSDRQDESGGVVDQLREIREQVRRRALLGDVDEAAEEAGPLRPVEALAPLQEPGATESPPPPSPSTERVNELWRAEPSPPGGFAGFMFRLLDRYLRPRFEAQRDFNSAQVQLDNALASYVDERSDATHRHYDDVLGVHGRRLGEIDERHMILQEELVLHVEELVRRIDLALAESNRGRLSLEFALQDVRDGLARLEESLRQR